MQLLGRANSNDLSLFAERKDLATLRADVVPRTGSHVVFLGERGVFAGLSAPLLLEGNCSFLLHRHGLGTNLNGTGTAVKAITQADEAVALHRSGGGRGGLCRHRRGLRHAVIGAGKGDKAEAQPLELVVPQDLAR